MTRVFTEEDVRRAAVFLQYGLLGAHHDSADDHHVATARALLEILSSPE